MWPYGRLLELFQVHQNCTVKSAHDGEVNGNILHTQISNEVMGTAL